MNRRWLSVRLLEQARWHVPVERRYCSVHAGARARDRCDRCGQPFCDACLSHVERWRVCAACLATLRRERSWQSLPQRLGRLRSEFVAGLTMVLVIAGTAGLIQHLLGAAASDASLVSVARQLGGSAPLATPALGQPALQLKAMDSLSSGNSRTLRTGVRGSNFRPGEAVRVVATWRGARKGSPVATKTVGPVTAKADAQGTFLIQADFGAALPLVPNTELEVAADGSQGSHAALVTVLSVG